MFVFPLACGGGSIGSPGTGGDGGDDGGGAQVDAFASGPDARYSAPKYSELWYSVDDLLVYIELDADDGSVVSFTSSRILVALDPGQNFLTMLDDGSLIGGRLSRLDNLSHFYHIATPPRDGSDVTPIDLGIMPDAIMLEGLYTDCDGRLYGMDTGVNDSSADGNRLLRFTGDYLASDFSYVVVSDLAAAVVADIDDMSPGIAANEITDNPGLAIDTGSVYDFDYDFGTGTMVGTGGTWGIHALGPELFTDSTARLYLLSSSAQLFQMDPNNYNLSAVLGTGPTPSQGAAGWSGLAGPLTNCQSGFVE